MAVTSATRTTPTSPCVESVRATFACMVYAACMSPGRRSVRKENSFGCVVVFSDRIRLKRAKEIIYYILFSDLHTNSESDVTHITRLSG